MKLERVVAALVVLGMGAVLPDVASAATIRATVSWTDNSNNEDGFRVERKTGAAGTFVEVSAVGPNVNTFADEALSPGTEYCWRIVAYNAVGSATSPEGCATTPSAPTGPSGVSVAVTVVP